MAQWGHLEPKIQWRNLATGGTGGSLRPLCGEVIWDVFPTLSTDRIHRKVQVRPLTKTHSPRQACHLRSCSKNCRAWAARGLCSIFLVIIQSSSGAKMGSGQERCCPSHELSQVENKGSGDEQGTLWTYGWHKTRWHQMRIVVVIEFILHSIVRRIARSSPRHMPGNLSLNSAYDHHREIEIDHRIWHIWQFAFASQPPAHFTSLHAESAECENDQQVDFPT